MVVESEQNESDIVFLKPLFRLSMCFGILSPNLQKNEEIGGIWKTYSLVFIAAMWLIYLFSLYGKIATFYYTLNYFALCMDVLCDLFMILADTFALCYCTFTYPKLSSSFISMLEEREIYASKKTRSFKRIVFYAEFGVIFSLLILYHAYNTYAFSTKLKKPAYGVILRVVTHYIVVIAVYQMYNFALLIRDKYRELNKLILLSVKKAAAFKSSLSEISQNCDSYLAMYSKYSDIIDAYNVIFGKQIFCIVGFVVINTVQGIQLGLICIIRNALPFISNDCYIIGIAIACETTILAVSIFKFRILY